MRPYAFALLATTLLCVHVLAQSSTIEEKLRFDYVGKVLTLRRSYAGEHLRFRNDGTLIGDAEVSPWTVDGQISVKEVHLRGNVLEIGGRRILVVFDSKTKKPQPLPDAATRQDDLNALATYHEKDRAEVEKFLREREPDIEIELPPGISDQKEISSAISAVFLSPGESMVDVVPPYWRAYFAELEHAPGRAPSPTGTFFLHHQGGQNCSSARTPSPQIRSILLPRGEPSIKVQLSWIS